MRFTVHDIDKDVSLMNFIRTHGIEPIGTRNQGRVCVYVYNRSTVVRKLRAKIKRFKGTARYDRHVTLWQRHIDLLMSLKIKKRKKQ